MLLISWLVVPSLYLQGRGFHPHKDLKFSRGWDCCPSQFLCAALLFENAIENLSYILYSALVS